MKEYDEIRKNLIDMLEELDDRLEKITEDVKHVDEPLSKDFAEQATETENDEVLDRLGNVTRGVMEKVKRAIARIDRGEYGYCVVCGEKIRRERLEILPYSDKCIKCAEKEDAR
ncbi:MAG: TraR/DksA family transcriptional regulator [Gammaproteobacteria bacterium]